MNFALVISDKEGGQKRDHLGPWEIGPLTLDISILWCAMNVVTREKRPPACKIALSKYNTKEV